MPKLSRLDPLAGMKRMFSMRSLMELAKAVGKIFVVIAVAVVTTMYFQDELMNLSKQSVRTGIDASLWISIWAAIFISASTLIIALIDIPFQIWDNVKKLKMSKQEVKDEFKDAEGSNSAGNGQ